MAMDPMQQAMEMGLGGGMPEGDPSMMGLGGGMPEGDPMMDQEMTMEEGEEAGRMGDTILAHMTPGEVVIPAELVGDPAIAEALNEIFMSAEIDMAQYTVGSPMNSINPETGNPEFGFFSSITKPFKKALGYATGARAQEKAAKKQMAEYARAEAAAKKESRRLMAEQQAYFKGEMDRFMAKQAEDTALFNQQIAVDQEKSRVMAIRNKRNFAKTLFGIQGRAIGSSKEAAAVGDTSTPTEFKAPKFYGSKRSKKSSPKFKRKAPKTSSVRPK